jgi:hypothetical protein
MERAYFREVLDQVQMLSSHVAVRVAEPNILNVDSLKPLPNRIEVLGIFRTVELLNSRVARGTRKRRG